MLLACVYVSAHDKGDYFLGASAGLSFGESTTDYTNGSITTSYYEPSGLSFTLGGEFGYFLTDNLCMEFGVGEDFASTPNQKTADGWLYDDVSMTQFGVSLGYFVKVSERCSYVPDIYFSYGFGENEEDLTSNTRYNSDLRGYTWGVSLLQFEFKVNRHWYINADMGGFGFSHLRFSDTTYTNGPVEIDQWAVNMNGGSLKIRYYF